MICLVCGDEVECVFPTADREEPVMCMECLWSWPQRHGIVCCADPESPCDYGCAALSVRATARTFLRRDDMGVWQQVASRDPVFSPFCDRFRFPLCLDDDEHTIVEKKENVQEAYR